MRREIEERYPFHFAIPRGASRASREAAPGYIAREFGVSGVIEHVRSEGWFHLYRIVQAAS